MTDDTLIARLQATTGPDRELDAAIAVASGQYVHERRGRDRQEWFYSTSRNYDRRCLYYGGTCGPLEDYTASIDAALTLVPGGWVSIHGWDYPGRSDRAIFYDEDGDRLFRGRGKTPALAICIAALRALEHHPT